MERHILTDQHALGVGSLLALAALSGTKLSAAQPRASLVITRADGAQDCPDADALAEQVRAIAGSSVVVGGLGAPANETWVQVAITRDFGGYRAQISAFGSRHGTRSLEDLGPTCSSLADAVAVTIAIFLDPYANAPAPAPATPQSALIPAPPPAAPKAPPPSEPERWPHLYLDASGGIAFNVLAHTKPLVAGRIGWRPSPRWALALGGAFVIPDTASSTGGGVALRLAYADLQSCGRALGDSAGASLSWCAGMQLGSLGGAGQGYQSSGSEHAAWVALAVGPQVVFPFTRSLAWLLTGEALVPLVRAGFDVQAKGVRSNAFQAPSVGGLVSLGLRGEL